MAGLAVSSEATFPVAVGPDLTYNGGDADGFVAKVNATGTDLEYCGYVGGSGYEWFSGGIAADSSGRAHVVGTTDSDEATFPVLVGPDLTYNGAFDAFVARVSADGSALERSGYIGGSGSDYGCDIALDAAGNAYVVGKTTSDETTFPVLGGPDLTYNGGVDDLFLARVSAAGEALDSCGYIGGSGSDYGGNIPFTADVAVDTVGFVYVTGMTASTEATFPVVVGPDLSHNGGTLDGFVAKVTPFDLIFADNFVSGDTTAWSHTEP